MPLHVTEVQIWIVIYAPIARRGAGLEMGGRADEIPRANVRQIIQHSVAGCGGYSGDHACTGLCARPKRARLCQHF
jgi:hypothetical protein